MKKVILIKIFREINYSVTSLVKALLSRNFCKKFVTVNFRHFQTVHLTLRLISRNFLPIFPLHLVVFAYFKEVFVLLEILELFEYLMDNYSIFELELFLLELETLVSTLASHARGPGFKPRASQILFLKKIRLCLQILPKLLLKSSADFQILRRRTLSYELIARLCS